MAYQKKEWINQVYDDEGNLLRKGTPIMAEDMNRIEGELEKLSEYPVKVDSNIQRVSEHDGKIATINQDIESIQGDIENHENRISNNEQKVESHGNRISIAENEIDDIKDSKGQPHGIATLGEDGIIPTSQIPSNLKEIRVVNTLADRDLLETFEGLRVMVLDASSDETVGSGWAEYVWDGIEFIKVAEAEGLDLVIKWEDVIKKPTQFPPIKHQHTESDISDLDKYTRDEVDNKLSNKSNKDHKHKEEDISDLDKYTREEINLMMEGKSPTNHKHTENDISDLDKYTKQEVDSKLAEKAAANHPHQEFQAISNTLSSHNDRIETLEEGAGQLHDHNNKSALDKIRYSGNETAIDLIALDELENHTHNYNDLEDKPDIPSKISDLEDDSNFIESNANRITVSSTAPTNPQVNDIWIVI